MSELHPCQQCRRHIRDSEQSCPFCAEQVTKRSPLGSARTVILASALAGASALGCSDERPATKAPPPVTDPTPVVAIDAAAAVEDDHIPAMPYGAPPPRQDLSDAAVPDAGAADAAVAKKRKKRKKDARLNKDVIRADPPPMPYGAPPARSRIV